MSDLGKRQAATGIAVARRAKAVSAARSFLFRLFKDDGAQALVEAVIVIPVILFVFMLMIQHLLMVQVAQIGNYAAFVAARVYAVRASLDEDDAKEKAELAAALAYAPVSKMAPGELFGLGGSLSDEIPSVDFDILNNVASLTEGFLVARYIRLDDLVSGGSVKVGKSGSPEEVVAEMNYAYPITIPGLAGLWKIIGGEKEISESLEPMAEGLEDFTVMGFFGEYPYVNVRSKCAVGYEDWGSDEEKYRPRKRKTVDDEEVTNPELEQQAQQMQAAQQEYEEAAEKMHEKEEAYKEAQEKVDQAQAEYDAVMADPTSTDAEKDAAHEKLEDAKDERDDAKEEYEYAKEYCDQKREELSDLTGDDYSW